MPPSIDRRDALRAALACGVGLGLGLVARPSRAHEYYVPHIRISHPWCRETAEDAPFALVCITFDEVTRADRLVRVETPVADAAEMSRPDGSFGPVDFPIVEAATSSVGEEGVRIRLVGLKQALLLGRSYPLHLAFARSGEVDATLDVAYEMPPGSKRFD